MAVVSSSNKEWQDGKGNSQDGALFSPTPGDIEVYPSGNFVNLMKPDPDTILLDDIAHHLSMCVRYAGGISRFYSVAEHCCLVYDLIPFVVDAAKEPNRFVELQKAALLHDAAEAYTGDMTAPLKWSLRVVEPDWSYVDRSNFDKIADRLDDVIGRKFDVDPAMFSDQTLKLCDLWAMKMEAERLTKSRGAHWRWPGDLPYGGRAPSFDDGLRPVEFVGGMRPEYAKRRWCYRAGHFWAGELV